MVHRIHHSCSTWEHFHGSLEKVKKILEANQYPPSYYNPIIRRAIEKIICGKKANDNRPACHNDSSQSTPLNERPSLNLHYRGTISDKFLHKVRKIAPASNIISTTTKLRFVLPPLKQSTVKEFSSPVVYKLICTGCMACYVGQTARHFKTRLAEHFTNSAPFK